MVDSGVEDEWERERARLQLESRRRMQDGVLTHAQLTAAGRAGSSRSPAS